MQKAFVLWFKISHPQFVNVFTASANGGVRDIITAKNLKDSGVKAGWPDIELMVPRGAYHGLFIELKVHPNKPSKKQKEVMASLIEQNYAGYFCYTLDDAIEKTTQYLKGV